LALVVYQAKPDAFDSHVDFMAERMPTSKKQ